MKRVIGFVFILFLFGCAPTVTHVKEPWMDNFGKISSFLEIGQSSKADILKKFGTPTTKTFFSSGVERWKYFYSSAWASEAFRHLGTYGYMDKEICFNFNAAGILTEFSYEETPNQ